MLLDNRGVFVKKSKFIKRMWKCEKNFQEISDRGIELRRRRQQPYEMNPALALLDLRVTYVGRDPIWAV